MTAKSIADILDAAADLITPEGAWTQEVFSRNSAGEDTGLTEFRGAAVCWCAAGAISKVADDEDDADDAAGQALRRVIGPSIAEWNDAPERTQAEVVAKLREAATLARTSTPGEA